MIIDGVENLISVCRRHREKLLEVTYKTGGSYLAQALSGIDMMTALFYRYMKFRSSDCNWEGRDRFLLSPGHYALSLYVILADLGYFDSNLLYSFKENGSPLELASHRGTVPGIEVSGGSLGQVLSVAVGMALHAKLRRKNHKVFVFMSDGEQDEGSIWEAAASAAHFRLENIIAVIDKNGFQVDGKTSEVLNMEPLAEKYRSFGWDVKEIDGNDMNEIINALDCFTGRKESKKPAVLIGNTLRGKGISFMEGNVAFHYTRLDENSVERAGRELLGEWDGL